MTGGKRVLRIALFTLCSAIAIMAAGGIGLVLLDRAYPPPLVRAETVSTEVRDADGQLLRAFATPDGTWRLKATSKDVDPLLISMLIAYEDQRFYHHHGVDPLALLRAGGQMLLHGHIVSGGSTLSMQVARLIEPRNGRSFFAKFRQMFRALQIEERLSKQEILGLYLTLAPYGGNLEGVRAASLAWFGKEPKGLTAAQSALLVALPQLPEARRPDRFATAALASRGRVLQRAAVSAAIGDGEAERAALEPIPERRRPLPNLAAHLAERARKLHPQDRVLTTALSRPVQERLEAVARAGARELGPKISVAIIAADIKTGRILASVGSPDYLDAARSGFVDMTLAVRSPGSTLKPFIYGLAFEQGLVAQETVIEDRPADFSGYRPRNFDMGYQGDVSIRHALQMSLNVPAIKLLDAVGPARLSVRFRKAGVQLRLPNDEPPGLAIGLGGAGLTLRELVTLYACLANRGGIVDIGDGLKPGAGPSNGAVFIEPAAAWNIADILSEVQPPRGMRQRGIAYKTGTSYGYRDAWSVGFDGRTVIGVWAGRADNGAAPGLTGYLSAAPILFDAFEKSGIAITPRQPAPPGISRVMADQLPASLRRFALTASGLLATGTGDPEPRIVYPPEGARIDLGAMAGAQPTPLALKLQGGRAPFRWLANGHPLPEESTRRVTEWTPDGAGYSRLTVIDANGKAASVGIFVE